MKNAIVTGATGFIGRWLVSELLQRGISVTAVVRPKSKNLYFLPDVTGVKIVECSMECYGLLGEKLPPCDVESIFYHLAWDGVSGTKRADVETQMKNVVASVEAVRASQQLGCTAFIGLGSIMEFESQAVANADGTRPGSGYIYGEAKHFAHLATKVEAAKIGISHLWPILTNAYGELEYSNRFINSTLEKILHHESLEFTSGTQIYDFIYVKDAVSALISIGESGRPYHSYVIGSGHAAPLRSFIERLGQCVALDQPLYFGKVPYTGVQLPLNCYSIEKLISDTGFIPTVSFEEGIVRTLNWLKKEENK